MKKLSVLLTFLVAVSCGFMYEVSAHDCEIDKHCRDANIGIFCCYGTCQNITCEGCHVISDPTGESCLNPGEECMYESGEKGTCASRDATFGSLGYPKHCHCDLGTSTSVNGGMF